MIELERLARTLEQYGTDTQQFAMGEDCVTKSVRAMRSAAAALQELEAERDRLRERSQAREVEILRFYRRKEGE